MFYNDHLPPHFHASYGEYVGLFDIKTLDMLEGDLPNRAKKMVMEWTQEFTSHLFSFEVRFPIKDPPYRIKSKKERKFRTGV